MTLVLDVDVTMTHSNMDTLNNLVNQSRDLGASVYLNTARAKNWCSDHFDDDAKHMSDFLNIGLESRLCRNLNEDVYSGKIRNMNIVKQREQQTNKCIILVDDNTNVINQVRQNGFNTYHVPHGIQESDVPKIVNLMKNCK